MSEQWTPTPWHVAEPYQGCDGTEVVGGIVARTGDDPSDMIGEFARREDAEHAVRCVNCHDALLAALEAMLSSPTHGNAPSEAAVEQAYDALEKANTR
jgi:hypothetical protein